VTIPVRINSVVSSAFRNSVLTSFNYYRIRGVQIRAYPVRQLPATSPKDTTVGMPTTKVLFLSNPDNVPTGRIDVDAYPSTATFVSDRPWKVYRKVWFTSDANAGATIQAQSNVWVSTDDQGVTYGNFYGCQAANGLTFTQKIDPSWEIKVTTYIQLKGLKN